MYGLAGLKRYLERFHWLLALIAGLIGFLIGHGSLWNFLDYGLKKDSAELEKIKLEKEFYGQLQMIQTEILNNFPQYFALRDKYLDDIDNYAVQNEYTTWTQKLANLIGEYDRLEVKVAFLEGRKVSWFKIPIPPSKPGTLHIDGEPEQPRKLVIVRPPVSSLPEFVQAQRKAIIEQYGAAFPATNP
jgi:hypothetical protein